MAMYDYKCRKCERVQEDVQHSMMEEPEIKCPDCGENMSKLITCGSGIIFKGDGWAGTGIKEKTQRIEKSNKLSRKMREM